MKKETLSDSTVETQKESIEVSAPSVYEFFKGRPERWTQDAYARDAYGRQVNSRDPAAVQWCIYGAVEKVYGYFPNNMGLDFCMAIGEAPGAFNDNHSFEEVLEAVYKSKI